MSKRRRDLGVEVQADGSWVVTYESNETRDGYRRLTIPPNAVRKIQARYGTQSSNGHHSRKHVALDYLSGTSPDRQRIGVLISEVAEGVSENSEDMTIRKQTSGLLKTLADRGIICREGDWFWMNDAQCRKWNAEKDAMT